MLCLNRSRNMKKLAYKILDKYCISTVDEAGLKSMILGEGYTVIRFSAIGSSDQTERLITALYLSDRAEYSDSFTYNDRERRIVFIRKDVSDDEYLYLLAVELGRILTFKTESDGVIGISASEDCDAHEFAHHMLDMAEHGIVYNFFKNYTVPSITFAISSVIVISILISFFTVRSLTGNAVKDCNNEAFVVTSDSTRVTEKSDKQSYSIATNISSVISSGMEDNSENSDDIPQTASDESFLVSESVESLNVVSEYYSTKLGKKYHVSGCSYISGKSVVPVIKSDIENGVYTACSRCIK